MWVGREAVSGRSSQELAESTHLDTAPPISNV